MEKLIRRIGLVAHDAMKKDLIEWVLWNSELLMGHKFYCTGTTGTLIQEALKEKHPDVEWDFTILKSGPLGGDQQMGSRIVDGESDYLFFFTDPMTLQPHDTDVKALTRLASVENIVFCCNRSTADHIISSPLFLDPDYQRTHPDYSGYTKRFENKPVVTEAVESVTRSTNGESVLLDKVYIACDGKNTISSREPIPATALDIENRILGSMEYFYDGLDSSGRPQYTVKASMTSNPLKLKSSKLVTRAEGVNSWHTNEEDHNGYTGTNSRSYVYTTPNPPSNPYCEAILTATDEKGDEYAVWKGTLRDAK